MQKGKNPPKKGCPDYDTKLHMMSSLQLKSKEYGIPLQCHYSQVHAELAWYDLLGYYGSNRSI